MKYKPGDKFIVEIEGNDSSLSSVTYYRVANGRGYTISETLIDMLKPYDERCELIDELKQKEYQRGLADAWEAVKTMNRRITVEELREIFPLAKTASYSLVVDAIMEEYTPDEAIAKIRAYEEIKVGDEITDGELKAIALELRDGYIHYLLADGTVSYHYPNVWKKPDATSRKLPPCLTS